MLNRVFLRQARDAIKRTINENPTIISIERNPLVDDGMGGEVENPYGTATVHTVQCRISHEQSSVPDHDAAPSGLSTNLTRYILVDHRQMIYEGDVFEAVDGWWRIGPVDPLVKFGGVVGYQAPLREAEDVATNT